MSKFGDKIRSAFTVDYDDDDYDDYNLKIMFLLF